MQTLPHIIRRLIQLTLWVTCGLFVLGVILGGGFLWRLSTGPVQVHFLTPYLEDALAAALGGRRTKVHTTVLAWDVGAKSLEVRARQVTIGQSDGTPLVTLPTVDVKLSAGALWRGTVALTAINIEDVSGVLSRTPEGTFQFDASSAATPPPEQLTPDAAERSTAAQQSQVIADLVQNLAAESGAVSPLATLQELRVARGTLVVQDKRLGVTWHVTQFDLTLRRHQHGLTGAGHITLAWQDALTSVDATLAYERATEQLTLDTTFADLRPAALATVVPAWQAVAGVDVPLSGKLHAALDIHGQLRDLRFQLSGGPGSVSHVAVLPHARSISSITVQGRLDGSQAMLHLDAATIAFGTAGAAGPQLSISGTAQELKNAVTINGQVTLTGLRLEELQDYWPAGVSADARAWLTDNLVAGTVEEAKAQVVVTLPNTTVPTAKLERLRGTLRYQDCEVHYLRPLPPATGVSGSASFDQQGFRIQINAGQITDMQITPGTVELTGLDRGRDAIAIRVGVDAPLRTVLTLLKHPHLNLLTDLSLDPAITDGQTTSQLGLAFPLRGQIRLHNVDITVHSTLTEVSIPQACLGQTIEHGQLTLDLNQAGMTLKGTAAFAAIPLTVAWQEAFSPEAAWKSDVRVTAARLDPMQLGKFGLDVTGFVAGPLAATVTARIDRQGKSTVQTTVNLQEAQLTLPFLGWHKPAHEPGEVQGTVQFMANQAAGQGNFRIQAGTLATNGAFQFNQAADPALRLELRDVAVGHSRFQVVTVEHRRKRVDVTLGEGVLDAQPLTRTLSSQAEDTTPGSTGRPDTSLPAKATDAALVVHLQAPALRRVSLGDDRYLQDVTATLTHGPEGWRAIDLAARIPDAFVQRTRAARQTADQPQQPRTFAVQYRPTAQGTYALSVRTNDFGAALRACDLHDGVSGGRLTIEGQTTTPRPDGPLQGRIEVKDFTIQRAPVLARLLAVASLTGLLNTLHGDGLAFAHLMSDFTLTDRVVTLRQLRAHGGALGLTVAGSIDLHASSVDLKGTIIPLYKVNTVVGKIPLVGDVLLGGAGQGLVAMAARVTGHLPDPQVSVNPASVVTPGFLRGFFDLFEGSDKTDNEPRPRQE